MTTIRKLPDGGAAFPRNEVVNQYGEELHARQDGMTLRDYFAAQAIRQMLPWNHDYPTEEIAGKQREDFARLARMISVSAYGIADAMLEERGE